MSHPRRWRPRGARPAAVNLATALAAVAVLAATQPLRPNLLVITLDTVRADRLGSYGFKAARTPVMDRLAREGVRFADATSHAPITGPAHAGLLTGRYPARFGIRDNAATPIPAEAVTLAEVLKGAGYRTGGFIGAFILDRAYGFDQGFDHFDAQFSSFDPRAKLNTERPASDVVARAMAWLETVQREEPFFAWLHLYDAHAPYNPPLPFDVAFRGSPYDGEIAGVDRAIGAILTLLESQQRLDRTLVVAIGDHGESLGEHGEDTHGVFLYDAVLRIPWVMRMPGKTGAGRVVEEQVRAIDLMPTVLEALGIAAPPGIDGVSLGAVIEGRGREEIPPSYAESYYPKLHYGWSELRAVRVGDWKFIDAPRKELYSLRHDPAEKANAAERQAALTSRLGAELSGIASAWSQVPERQAPMPDRETLERLKSLGYVGFTAPSAAAGRGPDPKDMIAELVSFNAFVGGAAADLAAGRLKAAAEKLRRALAINQRAYDVHVTLGDAYLESREYEKARGEYEAAALLNPGSADPLLGAVSVLLAQGKLDLATRKIDEAERLEPRSHEVAFARGRLSEQAGRRADALGYCQEAVSRNPADPRTRARLASLAIQLGMTDVAAPQFTALLAMGYQPARTHYGLGRVAEARGDRPAAIREYRRALALDPNLGPARQALDRLEARR